MTFLRSLDWILMLAAAGLVGYGLSVISGITRFDVPASRATSSFGKGSRPRSVPWGS